MKEREEENNERVRRGGGEKRLSPNVQGVRAHTYARMSQSSRRTEENARESRT